MSDSRVCTVQLFARFCLGKPVLTLRGWLMLISRAVPGTCSTSRPGNQAGARHSSPVRLEFGVLLLESGSRIPRLCRSQSPGLAPVGSPGLTSRRLAQPTRPPCQMKRSAASCAMGSSSPAQGTGSASRSGTGTTCTHGAGPLRRSWKQYRRIKDEQSSTIRSAAAYPTGNETRQATVKVYKPTRFGEGMQPGTVE